MIWYILVALESLLFIILKVGKIFEKPDQLVQIRNESVKDCDESYSNQELYIYPHIVILKTLSFA